MRDVDKRNVGNNCHRLLNRTGTSLPSAARIGWPSHARRPRLAARTPGGRAALGLATRLLSQGDQGTADTTESFELLGVHLAHLPDGVARLGVAASAAAGGRAGTSRTCEIDDVSNGFGTEGWPGQLTVGCIASAQREAVEAGLVAAWRGFAVAAAGRRCVIGAGRLWRGAALAFAARFGAVVVADGVLDLAPGAILWLFVRSTATRVLARSRGVQTRIAVVLGQLVTSSPGELGLARVLVDN